MRPRSSGTAGREGSGETASRPALPDVRGNGDDRNADGRHEMLLSHQQLADVLPLRRSACAEGFCRDTASCLVVARSAAGTSADFAAAICPLHLSRSSLLSSYPLPHPTSTPAATSVTVFELFAN